MPKTGGNTFTGTYFGSLAGEWSQGNNVDDTLKSYGIPEPTTIIKNWDTSFSMGGPICGTGYGSTRSDGPSASIRTLPAASGT